MRVTSWRISDMITWTQQATNVLIGGGLAVCALVGSGCVSPVSAAGVPPAWAQGFSEIVKKTTPAVVNIAVTGGGEGSRRRGGMPPNPFGTPPPGDEPGGGELPTPPPKKPGVNKSMTLKLYSKPQSKKRVPHQKIPGRPQHLFPQWLISVFRETVIISVSNIP